MGEEPIQYSVSRHALIPFTGADDPLDGGTAIPVLDWRPRSYTQSVVWIDWINHEAAFLSVA